MQAKEPGLVAIDPCFYYILISISISENESTEEVQQLPRNEDSWEANVKNQ